MSCQNVCSFTIYHLHLCCSKTFAVSRIFKIHDFRYSVPVCKIYVATSLRKNFKQHFIPVQATQGNKCVAECVNLCPEKEKCTSYSWGDNKIYRPGSIANLQNTRTKINKNGAIRKVRALVQQVILSGI